jgi:hypothetical protein
LWWDAVNYCGDLAPTDGQWSASAGDDGVRLGSISPPTVRLVGGSRCREIGSASGSEMVPFVSLKERLNLPM